MDIKWGKEILRWLYPPRCPVCGDVVLLREYVKDKEEQGLICSDCNNKLYRIQPPVCCRCGRPVEQEREFCINCQNRQFSYVQGFSIWIYNQSMRQSIAAFKYHGRREYAIYYGQEFVKLYGEKLKKLSVQALIPVPIYPRKQKIRGYNQAELFAKEIGNRLGIFVCSDYLLRVRNTMPQKLLDDKQRYINLQAAFQINKEKRKCYAGLKRVVLVDDIYTTGSTVEMCTKILLQAGIEKVYIACISIGS